MPGAHAGTRRTRAPVLTDAPPRGIIDAGDTLTKNGSAAAHAVCARRKRRKIPCLHAKTPVPVPAPTPAPVTASAANAWRTTATVKAASPAAFSQKRERRPTTEAYPPSGATTTTVNKALFPGARWKKRLPADVRRHADGIADIVSKQQKTPFIRRFRIVKRHIFSS